MSTKDNGVKDLPISGLVLHGIRPAKPSPEFVESIKENGVMHPIFVAEVGEVYHCLNGHQRIAASVANGKTTIPAIVMLVTEHLSAVEAAAARYQGGDYFATQLGKQDLYRACVALWAGGDSKSRQVRAMAAAFGVGRAVGEILHNVCGFVSAVVISESGGTGKWQGEALTLEQEEVKTNLLDFAALVPARSARVKGELGRLWSAWRSEAWRRETEISAPPATQPEGSEAVKSGGTGKAHKEKRDTAALTWTPKQPLTSLARPLTVGEVEAMGQSPATALLSPGLAYNDGGLDVWVAGLLPTVDAIVAASEHTTGHNLMMNPKMLQRVLRAADFVLRQGNLPYDGGEPEAAKTDMPD